MDDRLASLERAVAMLAGELVEVRERLARIEAGRPAIAAPVDDPIAVLPELQPAAVQAWVAVAGRTLLVLGGAYLLRALTAAHIVPVPVGIALGLLYGAPWLLLASRAAARRDGADAFSHGLATALIGYPLVWEATTRFAVFTPAQSAGLLLLLTAAALLLSVVQGLASLAAIVTCGAVASAFGLAIATGSWSGYTLLAIAVGLGTLWIGYVRDWVVLRWPAAIAANLMLFVLAGVPTASARAVVVAHAFALAGYLASFACRTLITARGVGPFEVFQSVGVLVFALGGLVSYFQGNVVALTTTAVACLVTAAATYGVTFTCLARRPPATTLHFYSLLALALGMVGVALAFGRFGAPVYALGALAAAWYGRRRSPAAMLVQTTVLLAAAAISSGLLATATLALVAPVESWPATTALVWFTLALTGAAVSVAPRAAGSLLARAARIVAFSLLVWTALGLAVAAAATVLPARAAADVAWLSTLRTILCVAAAFVVAGARGDAGRLTYPLVIVTGIKLALVDFPHGRPVTLFLTLALYGIALIVTPRLRRRPHGPAPVIASSEAAQPEAALAGR